MDSFSIRRRLQAVVSAFLGALAAGALLSGPAPRAAGDPGRPVAVLRDDFNGKFALNWKIVREDKDHISLTKDPGHLTIITQRGTIHGDVDHDAQSEGIRAKNIFLIPSPVSETSDFSITLAVRKFEPTTYYQQVGLLCYDNDENYVKWSFEYSWAKPDATNFVMVRQTDKVPEHDLVTELKNPGRFWLRVTRRGTDYECAYSTDGDKFTVAGSRSWGKQPPKFVGFLAKNGGNPQAGEIDVSIESFEVRSPPIAESAAQPAAPPAADSKRPAEFKARPAAIARDIGGVQPIHDPQTGVLILDNCDDQNQGKDKYEDNLTFVDSAGNLVFRVSGFNNCESIGSNHMVATDSARGWIWVFENVGDRIHKMDRTGKELLVIKDVKGAALAVDAKTGNLWVVTSKGTIQGDKTMVFDPNGRHLETHDVSGWDIAYDRKAESFWIAGPKLTKISAAKGDVSFVKDIAVWCSSCIAINPATGKVWVTIRQHQEVANSNNELLGFDNEGTLQQRVPLGDKSPSHVSVDAQTGAVWVTNCRKSVQRYSVDGVPQAEYKLAALAAEVDSISNDVWVATPEEVVRMSPEGEILKRVKHKAKTSQVWLIGI